MNLRMLEYLVALAETRHFGRAAERCFVSQPTLSAQLKKLEEELGVQLVERRHKNVTLTEAGQEIAGRARRIVEEADRIVEHARHAQDPMVGRLRLGMIPTVGPYLLPEVVPLLTRRYPRLKLLLYEYKTGELLERLQRGELDLAVLALPVPAEGLAVRPLFEEPFYVALPAAHRLAERHTLKVDDLVGETLLLLEDGHCLRDQALEICGTIDYREAQDFRATSLETLRQMVGAGSGLTLLPAMATEAMPASLVLRPLSRPVPMRRIGAVWHKASARQQTIERVCDAIVELKGASSP